MSLVTVLKVEKYHIAPFEEDRLGAHTEDQKVVPPRQKVLVALKNQLRDKEGNLRQVRAKLTVSTSELNMFRLKAEKVKEELSIAQTDLPLQTTL